MGITVTDLSTLDPIKVAQFDALLTQLITEDQPTLDVRAGVFHDLLIHLKSVLDAATQTNIDLVRQANSLLQINANPALADADIVNACLSNFNLVRNPGTLASGTITIVLSQLVGVIVPTGATFTINGLTFVTTKSYAARTSQAAVVSPTDLLITQIDTGQFAFLLPVTASAVGSIYNVTRASVATPTSLPPKFLKAYATADFTGGTDPQTNQQLLSLLAQGLAIKAWSGRTAVEALIRHQPGFQNIVGMSIIGFGDPEMIRDEHSIWPGHLGGRCDLYLRSQPLYQLVAITVNASLISKVGPLGTWQIGLGKNEVSGFYMVDKILLPSVDPTSAGFQPTSDVRSVDLSGVSTPPDIVTAVEGVYSRFQAAVLHFQDTITDASPLPISSLAPYVVVVRLMPLVAEVQDFLLERTVAPNMCDVVVKGAIPCFTSASFTVNYDSNTPAPSETAIQNAVSNGINNLGFSGQVSASFISSILHTLLTNIVSVTAMSISGSLRKPSGTIVPLSSSTAINVPNLPTDMVTGRTVAFFCRPQDITVTLNPVTPPMV